MNDLISRKELMEAIRIYADKKCENGEIELANGILKSLAIIKEQPIKYDGSDVNNIHEEYIAIFNKITDRFEREQLQHERFANLDDEYSSLHRSKISAFGDASNIVNLIYAESMEEIKKTDRGSLDADSTCQ